MADLHCLSNSRGTPEAHAIFLHGLGGHPYRTWHAAPVVKVATRSELARRWKDLIDFDAGRIATGEMAIEEAGWELFRLILDVASGRVKPWSDRWGCTTR